MNRLVKSGIIVFGILILFAKADAQNLPEYHFKMLQNDTLQFSLFSYVFPEEVAPFPQHGDLEYPTFPLPADPNYTLVNYVPDEGFTGKDEFVFEYRGNPGSGYFTWALKYSKIFVEVLPSIVTIGNDHSVIELGSGSVQLNVLANDSSTHGPLSVEKTTNIANGSTVINPDNSITFTPDPGFVGIAYFNYVARDAVGSIELGQASIEIVDTGDQEAIEEIELATLNTKELTLLLPASDYLVDDDPEHGELVIQENNIITFVPEIDFEGQDTFKMSNADFERYYYISIYDHPNDGLAVVDDVVFTLENEEVFFNVNDNDFKENYMDEWTQPQHGYVNYLGGGQFTYMPDEDYHGYDEFTYTKRVAPIVFQTATVRIGVGNFKPVPMEQYELNTLKNQAVVIDYDIPVEDYEFVILNNPDYGTINFYEGFQTLTIGCDQVSGYNLLVYEPEADFSGIDEFEVDYCPADASCQLVKVSVEVFDEVLDPACPCVGEDCVWKGDTNQDGVVDVKDLLPIGLYMGAEGNARIYNSNDWLGLNAEEWNEAQGSGVNLKHVDTDGNGAIDAMDTLFISANYDNLHTLLPKGVNAVKPYPIYLSTEQDSVNAGDYLHLTISVGNEDFPVVDVTGLTYSMQFPGDLIDSASLSHTFFEDGWFANASSTLQMDKQPLEGKVDAGFTRIGGIGVSGHGPIAQCDFIVEDDIEGFKLSDDVIPILVSISGGTVMDQNGNSYQLPAAEKTIYLDLRKKESAPVVDELIVYPNPAGDYVNIHLNGQNTFSNVKVFSSTGLLLDSFKLEETNRTRLDVQQYHPGVYFIVVESPRGKTAQRFEVIK
jgi:hypothetical protein